MAGFDPGSDYGLHFAVYGVRPHVFAVDPTKRRLDCAHQRAPGEDCSLYNRRLASGIASICFFVRLNSGIQRLHGLELKFIAAVSLRRKPKRWRGTVLGTLAGTAIMGVIAAVARY